MIKRRQTFITEYEITISEETGEIVNIDVLDFHELKKPSKKDTNPVLILESDKYFLTPAAMEKLGVQEGDRIILRLMNLYGVSKPVIGKASVFASGTSYKLSKKHTVIFKDSNPVAHILRTDEKFFSKSGKYSLNPTEHTGIFELVPILENPIDNVKIDLKYPAGMQTEAIHDQETAPEEAEPENDDKPETRKDPFESLDLDNSDNDTKINSDFFKL